MTFDYALDRKIIDAQDKVFDYLVDAGHTRDSGSEALKPHGYDWVDAWQNWWDEGED